MNAIASRPHVIPTAHSVRTRSFNDDLSHNKPADLDRPISAAGPLVPFPAICQTQLIKRTQVKRACIHCRQACKKCDTQRPCSRCSHRGLAGTCTDWMRKPRMKGVQRGPYQKRQVTQEGMQVMAQEVTKDLEDSFVALQYASCFFSSFQSWMDSPCDAVKTSDAESSSSASETTQSDRQGTEWPSLIMEGSEGEADGFHLEHYLETGIFG